MIFPFIEVYGEIFIIQVVEVILIADLLEVFEEFYVERDLNEKILYAEKWKKYYFNELTLLIWILIDLQK